MSGKTRTKTSLITRKVTSNTQLITIGMVLVTILLVINLLPRTHYGEPCDALVQGGVGLKMVDYGFPFTAVTMYSIEPGSNVCTYPEYDGHSDVNAPMLIANLLIAASAIYIGTKFGWYLADKPRNSILGNTRSKK